MKIDVLMRTKKILWRVLFLAVVIVCTGYMDMIFINAEESGSYAGTEGVLLGSSSDTAEQEESTEEAEEEPGTYTMEEGWVEDEELSTDDVLVYREESALEDPETDSSTISCSYMDTNYTRQDYEQLRDMLTNNLLYSNVNAQITTSAIYTLAKDYLYIILVDDSSEDYRTIYHYVVGDYQCFCVEVKEYREEAESAGLLEEETPQEIGQKVAEGFTWKEE